MRKDFDGWNIKKKVIDSHINELFFREGEIWWVHLGLNIGFETNGKGVDFMRPVIILKKYNQYSFLALPLSTSNKINFYRIRIGIVDGKEAFANLSQMRNIDSKRLINKVGRVSIDELVLIKKKANQVNFG
jgi:mRNA interferase MazF